MFDIGEISPATRDISRGAIAVCQPSMRYNIANRVTLQNALLPRISKIYISNCACTRKKYLEFLISDDILLKSEMCKVRESYVTLIMFLSGTIFMRTFPFMTKYHKEFTDTHLPLFRLQRELDETERQRCTGVRSSFCHAVLKERQAMLEKQKRERETL